MATRDVSRWETSIAKVVSEGDREEIIVRGKQLTDLIGKVSFSEMVFLMLRGSLASAAEARVMDALLVASMEHGIAPPSMVSRCYASYGTSLPAAVGAGISAFGDRMGGLGEQMGQMMVEQLDGLGDDVSDQDLRQIAVHVVADYRDRGERVPGYGISLHSMDPRAPATLDVAKREGCFKRFCRFAMILEEEIANARGGRNVPMNLDGVSACVALDLGFEWRTIRMFLLTARSVSMGAHFLEEQAQDTTWRHAPASTISYSEAE